jgi:hypothetical protein
MPDLFELEMSPGGFQVYLWIFLSLRVHHPLNDADFDCPFFATWFDLCIGTGRFVLKTSQFEGRYWQSLTL